MVRAPGHPRAGRGTYVFEHIVVAEQLLGRYLVDGESVHHRNGIRDDNRPENLELWTRPQPSGIRVSDAIEWARVIHDRYVGSGAPPTVLTVSPEHPWRWRDSNPRPPASQWAFSERSWQGIVGGGAAASGGVTPYPAKLSLAACRPDDEVSPTG